MNPLTLKRDAFPRGRRARRGMASVAVLVFSIVAVMILIANFQLDHAVSTSGDAFDTFNSQIVEKNGIAQVVKESILALRETAPANSPNTIVTEIQRRLLSLNFPPGVRIDLATTPDVPAHPFFPYVDPYVPGVLALAAAQPAYFVAPSDTGRGIAGMGGLFTSLAIQGPVSDLGRYTYTFARSSANAPGENFTYAVNADLFSVPLTNVDVVAYGLPASGLIPPQAPAVAAGAFASGVSTLIVTSNNPANDPTAYPDLYAPSTPEQLPYQFRNGASFAWNAYEYLYNPNRPYQNQLVIDARAEADPGNTVGSPAPTQTNPSPVPYRTGAVYDFSLLPFDPNSGGDVCNPTIDGVTVTGASAITIDCSLVQSQIVAVVDPSGAGTVTLVGSSTNAASPFVLLIHNTAGSAGRTTVNFSGNNLRPIIFYLENSNAVFASNPQVDGGLFLDPTTTATGSVTWFGHFSFYAVASPLAPAGTLNLAMNDSAAVKSALATIAPRALLVSTTATRQ